jgi:hypothetical protein
VAGAPSLRVLCAKGRPLAWVGQFRKANWGIYSRYIMKPMAQPIRVDNSRPATAFDTARVLGVSKKRTEAIIREVRGMIHKDAKTGEIVIRTTRSGKMVGNHSSRNVGKASKTASGRRKRPRILDAFGSFAFDPAYDYKAERRS